MISREKERESVCVEKKTQKRKEKTPHNKSAHKECGKGRKERSCGVGNTNYAVLKLLVTIMYYQLPIS